MIQELAEEAEDRIIIMPGGGVTKEKMSYLQYDILFEYHHSAREQIQSPHSSDLFEMNYKETVAERIALFGS
jgi:copper homeostasis protein CutC